MGARLAGACCAAARIRRRSGRSSTAVPLDAWSHTTAAPPPCYCQLPPPSCLDPPPTAIAAIPLTDGTYLLDVADDGTLGHVADGLHVADGQRRLLAAVQELWAA